MKLIITLSLIITMVISEHAFSESWADNWFDSATYSSGGSFESQKRNFVSGGSFSGRLNLSNDYLMSVQLPKLSAGCGGIDGFLGGMSFLDEDYLVQKFQNILQAAPAVAFDMALKTMCKECSETITKLEAAVNWLNGIQLNDCALAKKTVAVMKPDDPTNLSDIWTEMTGKESLKGAMDRSWYETRESTAANSMSPIEDLSDTVASCPASIKTMFGSGSVIDNMTDTVGMGDFSGLIKGYLGDVQVSNTSADMVPRALKIPSCPQNDITDVRPMLYGTAQVRNSSGDCVQEASNNGVIGIVSDKLDAVGDKMLNNEALTGPEIAFINNTASVNVYGLLKMGIESGTLEPTKMAIRDLVATGYTYYMMDSLFANTSKMFRDVEAALDTTSGDPDSCNLQLYTSQITKFRDLYERLKSAREAFKSAFSIEIATYMDSLEQQMIFKQQAAENSVSKSRGLQ